MVQCTTQVRKKTTVVIIIIVIVIVIISQHPWSEIGDTNLLLLLLFLLLITSTGQSCCSVERIYVHQSIAKDFIAAFVEEVKKFKVGDPTDPSTYIGPLTLPHQPAFLRKQLEDAVSKGAKVLVGEENLNGANSDKPGNWFNPTVLTNVNHTMGMLAKCGMTLTC